MKLLLTISTCIIALTSFTQADTLYDFSFDYREHYSGHKGKWHFSGESLYKDSMMYYTSMYGSNEKDTCVYFYERKWFYPNGNIKRHIYVDFSKRRRAEINDKMYSENGKLSEVIIKKANRKPEENDPVKVKWDE